MYKAKITEVIFENNQEKASNKICKVNDNTIYYKDKNTNYEIEFSKEKCVIKSTGSVEYIIYHQLGLKYKFKYKTKMSGIELSLDTFIENVCYNLEEDSKSINIYLEYIREDLEKVKINYKVDKNAVIKN